MGLYLLSGCWRDWIDQRFGGFWCMRGEKEETACLLITIRHTRLENDDVVMAMLRENGWTGGCGGAQWLTSAASWLQRAPSGSGRPSGALTARNGQKTSAETAQETRDHGAAGGLARRRDTASAHGAGQRFAPCVRFFV